MLIGMSGERHVHGTHTHKQIVPHYYLATYLHSLFTQGNDSMSFIHCHVSPSSSDSSLRASATTAAADGPITFNRVVHVLYHTDHRLHPHVTKVCIVVAVASRL